MAHDSTQPIPVSPVLFDNKENLLFKSASDKPVFRNSNGRRPRSRANNPPSPIILAREAARDPGRRRTHSPPALEAPTSTLQLAVDDMDIDIAESSSNSSNTQRNIHLPRYLLRPAFRSISPEALAAVDPELKGIPLEFLYHKLQSLGQQMFAVAATTKADPPRNRLPRELEVVINDLSSDTPTHLFAIYSQSVPRISIHPVHGLILAVHCANLPPLSHSRVPNIPITEVGSKLTLPVVPLSLPSPETFPILLHYLYTKRGEQLLASLLPMPSRDSVESTDQLKESLAQTFTVQALLLHASRVHGLWQNVCALGVFDQQLWKRMELVWQLLSDALALSTGAQWQPELEQSKTES